MRSYSFVAALAAFAPLATAALDAQPGHFSIQEVEGKKVARSVIEEIRAAVVKHNGTVPKWMDDAVAAKKKGQVIARPEIYDREFLVPVKIGTPAHTLNLVWDTGSSDLWGFSSALPAGERRGHTIYNPKKSKTAKKLKGYSWKIKYGDGSSSSGSVYKDKVSVGGLTVGKQAVEAASHVSKEFLATRNQDGIIGAGFSNLNQVRPKKQATFISNLLPHLDKPIVGAALNHHAPGHYDFGYTDPSKYKGPIHYTDVSRRVGIFLVDVKRFHAGRKTGSGFRAIVDTGTSVILVPNRVIRAYYSQIKKAAYDRSTGEYVFPCSETPPSISFTIAGSKRTVPGKYLKYAPDTIHDGIKYCAGGLQANTGLGDVAILGALFIKSQYVVFDYATPKIGFADKK